MMEERYHATTQSRFYLDMSNININITEEAKLIRPPTNDRYCYEIRWGEKDVTFLFQKFL